MNYLFYICFSLTLITLQTTIMTCFSMFDQFYDILVPFVFYLGLFRPVRESIPIILLLGFIVDSLSGGPFGIFLTAYFWFYVATRWGITFLHAANKILWLGGVAAGVLIENFIIITTTVWFGGVYQIPADVLGAVGIQMIWALCTGPVWVVFISFAHTRWNRWLQGIVAALTEQDA